MRIKAQSDQTIAKEIGMLDSIDTAEKEYELRGHCKISRDQSINAAFVT
jgi:hypothetical protein